MPKGLTQLTQKYYNTYHFQQTATNQIHPLLIWYMRDIWQQLIFTRFAQTSIQPQSTPDNSNLQGEKKLKSSGVPVTGGKII